MEMDVEQSKRSAVDGKAVTLGVSNSRRGPYVTSYTSTPQGARVIAALNSVLSASAPDSFRWSSIQVNVNTVSSSHTDKSNVGASALLLLGKFTRGAFVYEDSHETFAETGLIKFIDGSRPHSSQQFEGLRVSVIWFLHQFAKNLPGESLDLLAQAGFRVHGPSEDSTLASGFGKSVLRPTPLKGMLPSSLKSIREKENSACIGGMRSPHLAVRKVAQAQATGSKIFGALAEVIRLCPESLQVASNIAIRQHASQGFTEEIVARAKTQVATALGIGDPGPKQGISPGVIRGYCRSSGDPDVVLADWIEEGAPMGIDCQVVHTGIFPRVDAVPPTQEEINELHVSPLGWSNYRSAEDDLSTSKSILQKMVSHKWALRFDTPEEVAAAVGTSRFVLNKLALISKMKPDGTWKHRLVWDLLRSKVNSVVRQGERVVLPRPSDLVADLLELGASAPNGSEVLLLGVDIQDAFHQVPLRQAEWRYTVVLIGGTFFVFTVLVFGSGSSPTVWGRFAALLGRSTCAVLHQSRFRTEVYVDDPVYAASGSTDEIVFTFTIALLWATVLGFPNAWPKADGGSMARWIGASYVIHPRTIEVVIPEDKREEVVHLIWKALQYPVILPRKLRSLAGKLNFFASLVPTMRPFLASIWAVARPVSVTREDRPQGPVESSADAPGRSDPIRRGRLVQTKRCAEGLRWCAAFLSGDAGSFKKVFYFEAPGPGELLSIAVDASPWGIGGVRSVAGRPVEWFADSIAEEDLQRFDAAVGDSAFTTLWELLAVVVAIKIWHQGQPGACIALRSDSLSALLAIAKSSARSPGLCTLLQELALVQAKFHTDFSELRHIPGISNVLPDALSRLTAPPGAAKQLPDELRGVPRAAVPARTRDFWLTLSAG